MKTTTKRGAAKTGVVLETSRYGTPTPTFYLVPAFVSKSAERVVSAALYQLAAEIELATPAGESWVVVVDRDAAAIRLELATGDAAEASRGMALLVSVERA